MSDVIHTPGPSRAALFAVQEMADGTCVVMDCEGKSRGTAKNGDELLTLVKSVLSDPDLPTMEAPSPEQVTYESVIRTCANWVGDRVDSKTPGTTSFLRNAFRTLHQHAHLFRKDDDDTSRY